MDLTDRQKEEVEKIMASMECPCNFKCYKSGFKNLCKAEYHSLSELVECFEKSGTICKFRIPFGLGAFCSCPLRVYIAKQERK